jgi:spermidine synthase
VNYSHGSLHTVLRSAFETLALRDRDVRSVLMLGFGGGSAVRLLRDEHALDPAFTAVEIDPEVVALARRWFGFASDPRVRFVVRDAAEHVRESSAVHDLVLVDAFVDDCVPDALGTRAFLRAAGERVAPGGVLVFNTLADTFRSVPEAERIEAAARAELAGVTRIDVDQNRLVVWERARPVASAKRR